jgi:hypothetical protein
MSCEAQLEEIARSRAHVPHQWVDVPLNNISKCVTGTYHVDLLRGEFTVQVDVCTEKQQVKFGDAICRPTLFSRMWKSLG